MNPRLLDEILQNFHMVLSPMLRARIREVKSFHESGLPAIFFRFDQVEDRTALEVLRVASFASIPNSFRKFGVLLDAKDGGIEIRFATNEDEQEIIKATAKSEYDIVGRY